MKFFIYCDGEVEEFNNEADVVKRVGELEEFGKGMTVLTDLYTVDPNNHTVELTQIGQVIKAIREIT